MDFKNINSELQCDCLENSNEDFENLYAIKIMKSELRTQDFNSYWEKGRRPKNFECKEACSLKGVSISKFNADTKDEVVEIYKSLFPLAPKYKPYLGVIQFTESSGMTKHTPNEINKHHFDFFKCDTFDFNKVILKNINELH